MIQFIYVKIFKRTYNFAEYYFVNYNKSSKVFKKIRNLILILYLIEMFSDLFLLSYFGVGN